MKREVLKQVIIDQGEYEPPKNYFPRKLRNTIERFVDDPSIIILSGIRRSGKSTLQRDIQSNLDPSPYYINFDDERLIRFSVDDFQTLLEVFIELFGDYSTFYFDEIQNIEGWERFIRRLYESGKKIYITGSNATLLSKELGTHLTGRYIQFEVFPLSFEEVLYHSFPEAIQKKKLSSKDVGLILHHFSRYLKLGGIPEYVKHEKDEYLKSLLEGILFRDIIARYSIKSQKPLRELVYYFASNVGKEFSYAKLSKLVGLQSPNSISNYCHYLQQSYLSFFVSCYSHSLKKQIQSHKKCYLIDPSIINIAGFRVSEDRGRILENIVFLHLRQMSADIYYHRGEKECDFLIRESNKIIQAIQVTSQMSTEKTRKREIEGLIEAMEMYNLDSGVILTENEQEEVTIDGFKISIMPIWKWLLSH